MQCAAQGAGSVTQTQAAQLICRPFLLPQLGTKALLPAHSSANAASWRCRSRSHTATLHAQAFCVCFSTSRRPARWRHKTQGSGSPDPSAGIVVDLLVLNRAARKVFANNVLLLFFR